LTLLSIAASKPTGNPKIVLQTPGLVAFWDFGEVAGMDRISKGGRKVYALQEEGGLIARVDGGPFSGYSAELNGKQYLSIPYAKTGELNISGPKAQVSMFAVVRVINLAQSQTIAGIWSEGNGMNDDSGTRQYAMLMNMPAYGGLNRLVPHISSEGGVTCRADGTKLPWCVDYAATRSKVPEEEWCTLAFTYDGVYITAYINGLYEKRTLDPVKDGRTDRYFTKEGPGGKDRGMNPYYHGRGIFHYERKLHAVSKPSGGSNFTVGSRFAYGAPLKEATKGRFGGLAVFNRALTHDEVKKLHDAANVTQLNIEGCAELNRAEVTGHPTLPAVRPFVVPLVVPSSGQ